MLFHDGYITWRYWLRHTQETQTKESNVHEVGPDHHSDASHDDIPHTPKSEGFEGRASSKQLPCRVLVKVRGVQWFVYNRTPAYDTILQNLKDESLNSASRSEAKSRAGSEENIHPPEVANIARSESDAAHVEKDLRSPKVSSVDTELSPTPQDRPTGRPPRAKDPLQNDMPSLLNILPIGVECSKGAIVLGNQSTESILVATFASASGTINARPCRDLDLYKQSIEFDVVHPFIQFKNNKEHHHSQVNEGARLSSLSGEKHEHELGPAQSRSIWRKIIGSWISLRSLLQHRNKSLESLAHKIAPSSGDAYQREAAEAGPDPNRWIGLARYLDENDENIEQERWRAVEYARFPTLVDSPAVAISLYWDVPGKVSRATESPAVSPRYKDNVNLDVPPDWGVDVRIKGGTITYGPWADRQRVGLQTVFFPALFKDTSPAQALSIGQDRVYTEMKISIEIEETTTLRIPTREDSKDWKWKHHTPKPSRNVNKARKRRNHPDRRQGIGVDSGSETRPFGWLDFRLSSPSSISFTMGLVASNDGYDNRVNLDLQGVEISSSVNHALLLRSPSQSISCDLNNPLKWNVLRQWYIGIDANNLELWLLRDHIFLLTDLVSDWTSGPPSEFHIWVPFQYLLSLRLKDFRLYLNLNDANIIDSPTDVNNNTFLVVWGQELKADVEIPAKVFRPTKNTIMFDVEASDGGFELLTPSWNTQSSFMPSKHVASLKDLRIDGSYNYHITTSPTLTDVLLMNTHGSILRVELYGFLVRYFMNIKDNYFGDDIHFKTVDEYQELIIKSKHDGQAVHTDHHSRQSNDLDVIFTITATDCSALLPSQLYSATESINLDIASIEVDLRVTNYYMDLAITSSPVAISNWLETQGVTLDSTEVSGVQAFVDGVEIFGHRLFGLPPSEPTYVCNWDFDVGHISGDCSLNFLHVLAQSLQCFAFSFNDAENALPPLISSVIHDVTFLRAGVKSIALGVSVDRTALLLKTQKVGIRFNDCASEKFSGSANLSMPDVSVFLVDTIGSIGEIGSDANCAKTHAYLNASIDLEMVFRNSHFESDRQLQRDHIMLHDKRTLRTTWFTGTGEMSHVSKEVPQSTKLRRPAMCSPPMPPPITASMTFETKPSLPSLRSVSSARSHFDSDRKSSFLERISLQRSGKFRTRAFTETTSECRQDLSQDSTMESVSMKEQHIARKPAERGRLDSVSSNTAPRSPSRLNAPVLGLTFTSPYKKPHFSVLTAKPDTQYVPESPPDLANDVLPNEDLPAKFFDQQPTEYTGQTSLIVRLVRGLRVFCSPGALSFATQLQAGFSPQSPGIYLDSLQASTMNEILNANTRLTNGSKVVNLRLYTPFIRLRFVNKQSIQHQIATRQENYDFSVDNLTITVRNSNVISQASAAHMNHNLSLHLSLERFVVSAIENVEGHKSDQAVIGISICQPICWLHLDAGSTAQLQFRDFEIVCASRKIDYISILVHQSLQLVERLTDRLSRVSQAEVSRSRWLIVAITNHIDQVPEPPFLSGASYVLRSAASHLRFNDSWKMISRLRYVYQNLPDTVREVIQTNYAHKDGSCPGDGRADVVKVFSHWHLCDSTNVGSSVLIRNVFGRAQTSIAQHAKPPAFFKASVRAGCIRLLIDPGPGQNEISIDGIAAGLELNRKATIADSIGAVGTVHELRRSVAQVHCQKAAIRLNWSLCDLVQNIVSMAEEKLTSSGGGHSNTYPSRADGYMTDLHVVASLGMGIVNLDTLGLKVLSLCQNLELSVIVPLTNTQTRGGVTSMAIKADGVSTEMRNHAIPLTMYKLRRPSLLGSKDCIATNGIRKPWRFVGSGKKISFQALADILVLTEAAESFMRNEVAVIDSWVKAASSRSASHPHSPTDPSRSLPQVHVTLLLESYGLTIAILPTLTYQINGTGGKSTIKSGTRTPFGVDLDLDVSSHSHAFIGGEEIDPIELSALYIPPINGRLLLDLSAKQKSVILRALAEPIVLEATAVHSLITAINRPDIVNLGLQATREFKNIQKQAEQIFDTGKAESREPSISSLPTLYDANIILAGLTVRASTTAPGYINSAAGLVFNMGRIQIIATNHDPAHINNLTHPEIEIRLETVKLDLLRSAEDVSYQCGDVKFGLILKSSAKADERGSLVPSYQVKVAGPQINIYTESASIVVAIVGHLQDTLKTIEVSKEVKTLGKLGYSRLRSEAANSAEDGPICEDRDPISEALLNATYAFEMTNIQASWRMRSSTSIPLAREPEDLTLTIAKIDISTKRGNAARLSIQELQVQIAPTWMDPASRSLNSALLPEVFFNVAYVSTSKDRRLAFQAKGKSLDLRLTSQFILPASDLRRSIALAVEQVRTATASWYASSSVINKSNKKLLGNKDLASLLIDADFAGAVVYIQGKHVADQQKSSLNVLQQGGHPWQGRYNQFASGDADSSITLRAPGIAVKVQYINTNNEGPSLSAEIKVDASTNVLYPTVVPLIKEMSSSVKEIVGKAEDEEPGLESRRGSVLGQHKFMEGDKLKNSDPVAIFGDCRLSFGLRICRQEFGLSCQPVARVAATARFDDIYVTVNTVQSPTYSKFFSISATFSRLQASVQHVYSRDSTCRLEVDSVVLSLMNSKHVSKINGISTILKVSPMKVLVNAKQSQDFLLFRDIWVPPEMRHSASDSSSPATSEPQAFMVQRYQQVAATGAFPWDATLSIAQLDVSLDLGQSLGRSDIMISDFWVTSNKASNWEQNLCIGFVKMAVYSTGRMNGSTEMQNFKIRTSINWPISEDTLNETPLIQASLGFDQLHVKVGFDYQPFIIAYVKSLGFLMYNVRGLHSSIRDRLVAILDGDQIQVLCTTTSASQALALYQAVQRLIQEKQTAYEASLRDIEKHLRRKLSINPSGGRAMDKGQAKTDQYQGSLASSLKLQTNVVVTMKAVYLGAFPSTFSDNQIFKMEALDASARFAVLFDEERIHSTLSLVLGQLRIALSGVNRGNMPKTFGEVSAFETITAAAGSRGGTILKVPRLVATMQTWQSPESTEIDYIFKSSFQGRVDVGWNYSRISYIRGMFENHHRALAQRLGKPLPQSAVQITGLDSGGQARTEQGSQDKITAVVNVPQSKYQYTALQPAVIETPQLRDMGEATPPLEWIGLHRDRLPTLTHQIVIVTLLQLAAEVDDAYSKILGSS